MQSLVELIFNIDRMERTLMEMEIDTNKMPLGKLSEGTILKGVHFPPSAKYLNGRPHLLSWLVFSAERRPVGADQ